ncbi:MAG: metal-sensitive transcriptional regulator [Proteobacteria bacterium]|nr:metal-sensitive transcriptional regulator [Pseudomonadota bacterium]
MMDSETRANVQRRLGKIAGQVNGVARMVEEDRYCVDVLLQVAAARAALERVGQLVLGSHVETCVTSAVASRSERQAREKLDELLDVFSRFGGLKLR